VLVILTLLVRKIHSSVIIFLAVSLVVNLSPSSVCLSLQEENYFVGLSYYIYITASGLFSKYHEVEILFTVWKIVNIVEYPAVSEY